MGGVLLIPLIRGHRIVRRIYRRGVHHYNSRLVVCILFILGFHNKLVGIPIAKKSVYGWIAFSLWLIGVNDTLRMYKNDDIRMYNFNCITDTIVEVITTCNTYTLLTVHLL